MATFEVVVKCTVTKSVTCEAESEEVVRANPWEFAVYEIESDMSDWEVRSIRKEE